MQTVSDARVRVSARPKLSADPPPMAVIELSCKTVCCRISSHSADFSRLSAKEMRLAATQLSIQSCARQVEFGCSLGEVDPRVNSSLASGIK